MAKGTPATVTLSKADVAFMLHEYDYVERNWTAANFNPD